MFRGSVTKFVLPLLLLVGSAPAWSAIAFVQTNSATPQSPTTTVTVAYPVAQVAGNLNVIVIGWNDATTHLISVSDSHGNLYAAAVGPTVQAGTATEAIYYAPGVAAGLNTVTIQFDALAAYPDVRVAEYSGIATISPLDVAVGATGNSAASSSGAVTTANANDLLVAGNLVQSGTTAAGANFTKRVITTPDSDILEDRIVTAAGSYSATAAVSPSAAWIMQMAAFKASTAVGDTQAPTAPASLTATAASSTQINLSWVASTDNVGVTGYLIERCSGAGCTAFAQIANVTTTTYSSTALTGSTPYSYRVRATDAAANVVADAVFE